MCLGVPGEVVEIGEERAGLLMGKVSFGGIVREVCLAYTPEVEVGQYVLVHVGFALSQLDEQEAQELFSYLEQIDALEEAARAEGGAPAPGPDEIRSGAASRLGAQSGRDIG
ncbi:MAG: HypC/HybG/HupF family hydrogenase formation chaperone [Polyangiaceae bacterium]|nr:HypC/HybG/HupF family hydrogenase formation chaperone [Polyangiaceae bacterium]